MPVNPFKNGPGWVLPPLFQHIANDKLRPRVRELQRCFRKYSPRRRGVRILPASSAAKVALWRRKAAAIGPIRGPYRRGRESRRARWRQWRAFFAGGELGWGGGCRAGGKNPENFALGPTGKA